MSGKPIKLKDLIDVHFTDIQDRDSKTALINKQNRYVCAVTNDILGNSVPAAVLRTSYVIFFFVNHKSYQKLTYRLVSLQVHDAGR